MDMEKKKKAVATMICLFTLTFGAKIVDVMFYKADAGWDEFTKYNAARTQYSDFKVLDLPEENPFSEKGISDIDMPDFINMAPEVAVIPNHGYVVLENIYDIHTFKCVLCIVTVPTPRFITLYFPKLAGTTTISSEFIS